MSGQPSSRSLAHSSSVFSSHLIAASFVATLLEPNRLICGRLIIPEWLDLPAERRVDDLLREDRSLDLAELDHVLLREDPRR